MKQFEPAPPPAETLDLTRYTDGRVECDVDPRLIAATEHSVQQHEVYSSFDDMIERNPHAAYDFFRKVIQAAFLARQKDGTPTVSHLKWDSTTIYDPADKATDYDPTEIASNLVLNHMLPERYKSKAFRLSVGTPTTETDRQLLGEEARRIELYNIEVTPDNYAF